MERNQSLQNLSNSSQGNIVFYQEKDKSVSAKSKSISMSKRKLVFVQKKKKVDSEKGT